MWDSGLDKYIGRVGRKQVSGNFSCRLDFVRGVISLLDVQVQRSSRCGRGLGLISEFQARS